MSSEESGVTGIGSFDLEAGPPLGFATFFGMISAGAPGVVLGLSEDSLLEASPDASSSFAMILLRNLSSVQRFADGSMEEESISHTSNRSSRKRTLFRFCLCLGFGRSPALVEDAKRRLELTID